MPEESIEFFCPWDKTCECIKKNRVHRCRFYVKLLGKDPQTGREYDENGCAITFLPILLCENSKMQHQNNAVMESFRNSVIKPFSDMVSLARTHEVNKLGDGIKRI